MTDLIGEQAIQTAFRSASLSTSGYVQRKRKWVQRPAHLFAIMESELYTMLSEFFVDIAENLEDYVETFLKIYKEADRSAEAVKQLNRVKVQLEKENRKRDKLLELYMEETITKAEFTKRNTECGVIISDLEEEVHRIEKKIAGDDDYADRLKKIEKYFRKMYDPNAEMNKEQVDAMAKAVIDRITVVPISENKMKLEVKLKNRVRADDLYKKWGKVRSAFRTHEQEDDRRL